MAFVAYLEIPHSRWTDTSRAYQLVARDGKQAIFDELSGRFNDLSLMVRFKPAGDLVVSLIEIRPNGTEIDRSDQALPVVESWL